MSDEDKPLPVKSGDWVASIFDSSRVATVRACYWLDGECLTDLVLYSYTGEKIGRESRPEGGPRRFEPACHYAGLWQRIKKPMFPFVPRWVDAGNGRRSAVVHHGADVLPDREYQPRTYRKRGAVNNFDPRMEAAALRRAAQELRDVARASGGMVALIQRAEALEREAAATLSPIM